MRISDVTPLVVGTPWRNLTIVRVRTDDGVEGVGEVRMVNHTDALLGYLKYAAPTHVVGSDPFDVEALVQRMRVSDFERAGSVEMSGAAAVEIACWDIMGKALGVPVYRLLGGAVRDRIKAYANGWYTVERTPEEFHAAARRVVARGYDALKVDPFGAGSAELEPEQERRSIALVEAVRDAIGPDRELMVEMHGRFTAATAIRIAHQLEPFRPAWIEEPVPPENLAVLSKVGRHVSLPIATGERIHVRHEFRELFEQQAADVAQPDTTTIGGIAEAKKIAAWADAYQVLVAPHNVGGAISTAAALHIAASTPNFKIQEHFNDFAEEYVKEVAPGNPEVRDGHFGLPERPGLGVLLDEAVAREHPMRDLHFDLYAKDWHFRDVDRQAGSGAGG
jgi:galactonate dehydratase